MGGLSFVAFEVLFSAVWWEYDVFEEDFLLDSFTQQFEGHSSSMGGCC